jgi:SnoaL-like domain
VKDAVVDRFEISELAFSYSSAASRQDASGMGKTFVKDGRLGGVAVLVGQGDIDIVGADAIGKFFAPLFANFDFIHHTSQPVDIKVDGDKAQARTMIIEWARPKGGQLMMVMGEYIDDVVRTEAGWRFARRVLKTKSFGYVTVTPVTS